MIGQKAALMVANMAFGTVLGFVASILVGRFFDPLHVGEVAGALGILGILFFVTDFGMGAAHVKRVSEGRDPGDCFATFAVFKLVSTTAFVLLVAAGLWSYVVLLGKPLVDTTVPVVLLVLGYYVAKSLAEVGQSSFDARLETAKSQSAQLADTLVRIGLTVFFALAMARAVHHVEWARVPAPAWVVEDPGRAFAFTWLAGALAAAVVSVTLLLRTLEWGRFRWDLLKDYASFALPLFFSNAIGLIAINIDRAALLFFGGAADAGIFEQVRRLPLVLAGLGTALSAILFPAVSAMFARGDHDGIKRTTDGALRHLSLLLAPIVAFTIVFPYDLIRLTFGEKWLSGGPALAILTLSVLLTTFGHVHSFLIMGTGRPGALARVGITSATILVLANLVLVPDDLRSLGIPLAGLGVTGAALASLLSGIVWYGGLRWMTRRHAAYREPRRIGKHVAAALVMVGALYLLDATVFPLVRIYHFAAYVVLGALLYGTILVLWGELSHDDHRFLRSAMHPGAMLRYVTGEIRRKRP